MSWERIIDHIDHVVKLVGADHVGLGSDFDGANMPEGMEDCTQAAKDHRSADAQGLQRRRHSQNSRRQYLLRVMEQTEKVSREMQARNSRPIDGEMRVEMVRTHSQWRDCVVSAGGIIAGGGDDGGRISERAKKLHFSSIVVDTHDDTTQRFLDGENSISAARHPSGSIDIPRMREGGLERDFLFDLDAKQSYRPGGGEARAGPN